MPPRRSGGRPSTTLAGPLLAGPGRGALAREPGRFDRVLRDSDRSRTKVLRAAESEDFDVTGEAPLLVAALESSTSAEPLPAPAAGRVLAPPGSTAAGTVPRVVEDLASGDAKPEDESCVSSDGGSSRTPTGVGRSLDVGRAPDRDSRAAPSSLVSRSVVLRSVDGRAGGAGLDVTVDHLEPLSSPELAWLAPPEDEDVAGPVLLDAFARPGPTGRPERTGASPEPCADSPDPCWSLGADEPPTEGLTLEWDSTEVADGPPSLRALGQHSSSGAGLGLAGAVVDDEGKKGCQEPFSRRGRPLSENGS